MSTTPTFAQENGSSNVLEEIVVTARKRAENLQETPVAISVFSGSDLTDRGVTNISELSKFTPNMSFDRGSPLAGSSNSATVFIRGVGQTDFNLTIDPGIGIYMDGVYISRSIGALLDTIDIENVQVLRGPQGTLFGKNTIGGAIVVTSTPPGREHDFGMRVTTGRYNRSDLSGFGNIPVGDSLSVRVSAAWQKRDGYVDRLVDGGEMGDQDRLSGRFAAQFDPNDELSFVLAVDASRSREQVAPLTLLRAESGNLVPTPQGLFAFFNNVILNGGSCALPPAAPGLPPSGNPAAADPACFNSQWVTNDPLTTYAAGVNTSDQDTLGVSLTAEWTAAAFTLKSISAFRELDSEFFLDSDSTPVLLIDTNNDYSQEQFSQEFQISGLSFDERLNWLVGLYYLKETGTDINNVISAPVTFRSGGEIDNDSFAVFSQATYNITDAASITVGGRFTDETKRFTPDQIVLAVHPAAQAPGTGPDPVNQPFFLTNPVTSIIAGMPLPIQPGDVILPSLEAETTASDFTPSLSFEYRFTNTTFAYAGYSEGFKSGGFTQRVFPPEPVTPSFDPEFVETFELGLKTSFFKERTRLNVAVFVSDYDDLQIIVRDGLAPKVRNAGNAEIRGIEAELETLLPNDWRLTASVGYLDSEYKQVDATAIGVGINNELANTPDWTASAILSGELSRPKWGVVSTDLAWSYKGGHFKDAVNTAELFQESTILFDAALHLDFANDRWRITAGVYNLTNEIYLVTGYQDTEVLGIINGFYSRPREWYLSVSYDH